MLLLRQQTAKVACLLQSHLFHSLICLTLRHYISLFYFTHKTAFLQENYAEKALQIILKCRFLCAN